jgi:uncharacterized protein (UPF0332 family)
MTFENFIKDYSKKGLLKQQKTNFKTIENTISRAYKEIIISKANLSIDEGISFTVAYTAMLHAARALMFLKGFRPNSSYQHKTAVDFASVVLGDQYKTLIQKFDRMRKKRNIFIYEVTISISKTEVSNAIKNAEELVKTIRDLIEGSNPQYKFKF